MESFDCGVFLPIVNNGWIYSVNSPQYMPTFELNRETCVAAERAGFEFALSQVKLRGFGGECEIWDYAMESFTLTAGLAAATTSIRLYASVAAPTLHPAIAARMAATIDDISPGRFGINIVSGWNKFEYDQMGLWRGDEFYNERYDYSTEYVEVMRQLWESGRTTYDGRYFQLEDCVLDPRPKQPMAIVCAGQSERGMRFTAEVGDYNFVLGDLAEVKSARARLDAACEKSGRTVGAYALFGIVAAATDDEAVATANSYLDGTDRSAIENEARLLAMDKQGTMSSQVVTHLLKRPTIDLPDDGLAAHVQGSAFPIPHLVGSYDRIARHLDALKFDAGMSGVIMTFPEFVSGVTAFGEHVIPHMKAGADRAS